jgi:hypothetical protein
VTDLGTAIRFVTAHIVDRGLVVDDAVAVIVLAVAALGRVVALAHLLAQTAE